MGSTPSQVVMGLPLSQVVNLDLFFLPLLQIPVNQLENGRLRGTCASSYISAGGWNVRSNVISSLFGDFEEYRYWAGVSLRRVSG